MIDRNQEASGVQRACTVMGVHHLLAPLVVVPPHLGM